MIKVILGFVYAAVIYMVFSFAAYYFNWFFEWKLEYVFHPTLALIGVSIIITFAMALIGRTKEWEIENMNTKMN